MGNDVTACQLRGDNFGSKKSVEDCTPARMQSMSHHTCCMHTFHAEVCWGFEFDTKKPGWTQEEEVLGPHLLHPKQTLLQQLID